MAKRVFIRSLGCSKNMVDAEVMAGVLLDAGFEVVSEPDNADVIIVNTCAFIDSAKEESIETILEMAQYKEEKCDSLIVSGCLPQRYASELQNELHEVDVFVGVDEVSRIAELTDQSENMERIMVSSPAVAGYPESVSRALSMSFYSAYVKVSEGCHNRCHYCVIPDIRGALRSRPIENIVREADELAKHGVLEINLIAQDLTSYGLDLAGRSLLNELLHELENIEGLEWIRLLYAYPTNVSDELLETMAASQKIAPYIDMPVQHINDSILENMGRDYSRADLERIIEQIRSVLPDVALRTSLMVGFPGETDSKFQELLEFVSTIRFDNLGCFAYSPQEGTPAASLPGHIPDGEKRKRLELVMETQRKISAQKLEKLIGCVRPALIEGPSEETELLLSSRLPSQAPEIDGVTYINKGNAVIGEIVPVLITDSYDYDLVAEILEEKEITKI